VRTLTLGVIEDFKFKFKFKTDLTMGLGGGRPPIKAAPLRSHLALSVTVSLKSRLCVAVAGTPATRWRARQGFSLYPLRV